MRRIDLDTSAAQLHSALKDLQLAWHVTCESWNDGVSRQFAEQHLDPLIPSGRMTIDAVNRMRELIGRIERECNE
jgi:hypothetical protein